MFSQRFHKLKTFGKGFKVTNFSLKPCQFLKLQFSIIAKHSSPPCLRTEHFIVIYMPNAWFQLADCNQVKSRIEK